MRFGIITFHDANNYGAVLQAYALNKKINEYNNCELINYYNSYFHRNENMKGLKYSLKNALYKKSREEKNVKFENFRKEHLNIKSKFILEDDFKKIDEKFDCFITGSDQVWNLKCSGNNDTYFLDFVTDNRKKYSYSASFGTSNPNLDNTHLNYIKDFNLISVREKSGFEYLKNNGINATKTSDPVFLLKKEQWESLTKTDNEKYILIYEVVNGVNMLDLAKKISKKTGYKIRFLTSSNKPIWGVKTIRNAGPIEWLSLIKNAEFVITNSFHGLAFSLIFNKQFIIEPLPNSDSNTRMAELLSECNLESRMQKVNDLNCLSEINYNHINEIIENSRQNSIRYIESIVRSVNINEK